MFHEPDTSQNADPRDLEAELFASAQPIDNVEPPPEPLRFSLAQLLIGTTIAAVLLALFRALGIWGAVLSFGAALIFTLLIYPQANPGRKQQQALMFDFVWGIVMPVVCLVFDPFVFKGDGNLDSLGAPDSFIRPDWREFSEAAFIAYPVLAWQLAVMAVVLVIGRLRSEWAAAATGSLFGGMFVAGAIGVMLLPLSTLGLMVVWGMLGYTPLLTAYSFGRRAREMWRQTLAKMSWRRALAFAILGALLAALLPAGSGLLLLQVQRHSLEMDSVAPRILDSLTTEFIYIPYINRPPCE